MKKRIIILIVTAFMLLTGCSDKAERDDNGALIVSNIDKRSEEGFKAERLIEDPDLYITNVLPYGEAMAVYGYRSAKEDNLSFLKIIDFSGKTLREIDLSSIDPSEGLVLLGVSEGNLYGLFELTDEDENILGYKEYQLDADTPLFCAEIPLSPEELPTDMQAYTLPGEYVSSFFYTVVKGDKTQLINYSFSGQEQCRYNLMPGSRLLIDGEATYISTLGSDGILTLYSIDLQTGDQRELERFDNGAIQYIKDGQLYLSSNTALYSFNLEDGYTRFLYNWSDIGFIAPPVKLLPGIEPGLTVALAAGESQLFTIKNVEADTRQELILATADPFGNYRAAVNSYNSTSQDYVIRIRDYSELENGQDILNTELLSGRGPDIVDLTSFSSDIINGNAFEDLKPWFQQEQNFPSSSFLPGVLEALETEGHIYCFVPSYWIYSIICPAEMIPEDGFEGFDQFVETAGTGAFGQSITRSNFLSLCFGCGKLDFSVEEVKVILDFAAGLPEKRDLELITAGIESGQQTCFLEPLSPGAGARKFSQMTGEEMVVAGWPVLGRNSGVIVPSLELAMVASSEHKEAVWGFLVTLLTEQYLADDATVYPLTQERFEAQLVHDNRWTEQSGVMVFRYGLKEYTVQFQRGEQQDQDWRAVSELAGIYHQNSTVFNIVMENAAPFFAGDKNAQEAAEAIVKRIAIYASEKN